MIDANPEVAAATCQRLWFRTHRLHRRRVLGNLRLHLHLVERPGSVSSSYAQPIYAVLFNDTGCTRYMGIRLTVRSCSQRATVTLAVAVTVLAAATACTG
jgi:hypothetical protein